MRNLKTACQLTKGKGWRAMSNKISYFLSEIVVVSRSYETKYDIEASHTTLSCAPPFQYIVHHRHLISTPKQQAPLHHVALHDHETLHAHVHDHDPFLHGRPD